MRLALAGVLALAACARPATAPPTAPRVPATSAGSEPRVWAYEVVQRGPDLDVKATFPPGSVETFSLEDDATRFVADVGIAGGKGPVAAAKGGIWTLAGCAAGCTVQYTFHLDDAARGLEDVDTAMAAHGCLESPPSAWLLRPTDHAEGTTYRMHVHAAEGSRFATGVRPTPDAPDTFGAAAGDLDTAPYTVFGPFRTRTLARTGAAIELAILPGHLALDDAAIDRWVQSSARAIESYYGRFPVPRVLLILSPVGGSRGSDTADGRTLGSGGASILLGVSGAMGPDKIASDWVLTHEMTHLALPNLPRHAHWLEEGLATYIEPIARARVGTVPDTYVWRGLVDGLPNGEPMIGDEGLDRTHTWGRTYWGGALFSFVADLAIRKRTNGAKSLEDALRGIVAAGGNCETSESVAEVLHKGDEAVGAPVLEEMYAKWSTAPVDVDLTALWKDLGVRPKADGAGIDYDDSAPLAGVRRAITAAR